MVEVWRQKYLGHCLVLPLLGPPVSPVRCKIHLILFRFLGLFSGSKVCFVLLKSDPMQDDFRRGTVQGQLGTQSQALIFQNPEKTTLERLGNGAGRQHKDTAVYLCLCLATMFSPAAEGENTGCYDTCCFSSFVATNTSDFPRSVPWRITSGFFNLDSIFPSFRV